MSSALDGRWVLVGSIAVVTIGLLLVGRRLGRRSGLKRTLGIGALLALAAWVPGELAAALLVIGGSGGCSPFGGWIGGLVTLIPGGAPAVGLTILVAVGAVRVRGALATLGRMRRARKLEPGEIPRAEVQIGGKVKAREQVRVPQLGHQAAAWSVERRGIKVGRSARRPGSCSEQVVELATEHGTVLLDPRGAELDVSTAEAVVTSSSEEAGVAAGVEGIDQQAVSVRWLADGAEVFVIGVPRWEAAAAGEGTYRQAPTVPVFRATHGSRVYVTDRSEQELRQSAQWRLTSWVTWGALSVAVAAVRIVFPY